MRQFFLLFSFLDTGQKILFKPQEREEARCSRFVNFPGALVERPASPVEGVRIGCTLRLLPALYLVGGCPGPAPVLIAERPGTPLPHSPGWGGGRK